MVYIRDASVDILRGIAIFTMIAADLAAQVLTGSQPFLLRLYGSFAAPLFITISGMMVYQTVKTKGYRIRHFSLRGGLILAVGVLIDVFIWGIYPFTTVDVLYLIGVSLPIAYLSTRAGKWVRWTIIVLIFIATPVFQTFLGYTSYPTEVTLLGHSTMIVPDQTSIFNHWIIDGWFPIFPWLGFSLLGVNLAETRRSQEGPAASQEGNAMVLVAALLLCSGVVAWLLYPGSLLIRGGYAELFYPPTIGYILTAFGLFMLLLVVVDRSRLAFVYRPFKMLGESSLFMYIMHLALIEYIFALLLPNEDLQMFLFSYVALVFVMTIVAYGLRVMKVKRAGLPFIIRFLIGS